MTPTLSDEAFHFTVTPVWVRFEVVRPVGFEGAWVSEQAVVDTITTACWERLPAAS